MCFDWPTSRLDCESHLVASSSESLDLAPPLLPKGSEAMHQQEGGGTGLGQAALCSAAAGLCIRVTTPT